MMKLLICSMALIGIFLFHSSAIAASFDCMKATTPREKVICSNPALSKLDTQLNDTYQEKLNLLSADGVKQLEHSQQGWLHYIATVCPLTKPANTDDTLLKPKDCLVQEYTERLKQLSIVQKLGPFVFNRIDLYAAKKVTDSEDRNGSKQGFYAQHTAYPQIDNSDDPIIMAWNAHVLKKLPLDGDCDAGDGDYYDDYTLQYANKNLISTTLNYYQYCHGAAHGMGGSNVENFVVHPTLHEMKASDVFGSGNGWIEKFQNLAWEALKKQDWAPPQGQEDTIQKVMFGEFIKPSKWTFTPEGIKIGFNSYDGGCYACTPQPITLSWQALKPLMAPDSIVP